MIPIDELTKITRAAIEASARLDRKRMQEQVRKLDDLDAGPVEALAFVVGCMKTIVADVPPEARDRVVPGIIGHTPDGSGEMMMPGDPRLDRVDRILIALGASTLYDAPGASLAIWMPFFDQASEAEIADAIFRVLTQAGAAVRRRRAHLS